jgi:hypothetical protein
MVKTTQTEIMELLPAENPPPDPQTDRIHATTGLGKAKKSKVDYEKYRPNLAWLPTDRVRNTFKHTTQL